MPLRVGSLVVFILHSAIDSYGRVFFDAGLTDFYAVIVHVEVIFIDRFAAFVASITDALRIELFIIRTARSVGK